MHDPEPVGQPEPAGQPRSGSLSGVTADPAAGAYAAFCDEVATRQVDDFLPEAPARVVTIGGGVARASRLRAAGHDVLQVLDAVPSLSDAGAPARLVAEPARLDWLSDECVDALCCDGAPVPLTLALEVLLDDVRRVLRPGGRLLLRVDSSVWGLSRLAEAGRWAELSDAPAADVVLVPTDDGGVRRCFWPDELTEALADSGLTVDWVRPRTVLSADAVRRALAGDLGALPSLVETELTLEQERAGESIGNELVAAAHRPD